MKLTTNKIKFLHIYIYIILFTSVISLSYAQTSNPNLRLIYKNNLITISAQNADLKNVLLELADKTNIIVRVPNSLKKQITITLSENSLDEALSRILRDMNYAIIYSGEKNNRTVISEVLIYNESESSEVSSRSESSNRNINNSIQKPRGKKIDRSRLIKSLERRLENLNKKLSLGDISSSQRERYLKQIRAYENKIEQLKREIE
jgi:type II secretory pathway component GspD/PulD (secretin)